ncbi:peptidoglycan DD-metalloendopeptidase family protein [Sphingobacterium phlebotomi]|uniref:Peptidoglycan DD-metalloendopeptidase family protein n=1 Tax=Sphingobacterium phlebotomi TaxID=2605433 RepID=A0A5D4H0B7_9SPHI|nr:M23 family metallopeptidase [Sphingobacterium phlebotomi]TYR34471.1 peptidoglycan DD-metalloendopeptidase family protein [Sphingobacterium phlebotomi]
MLKKKTAVLFVEPDGTSTKRMQVPTFVINHWKKVLCSFVTLTVITVLSVVYVVKQRTSEKYIKVYDQKINKLKAENRLLELDEFNNQLTTEEIKKSFNSIDSAIDRINQKMKKRGLKEIKMSPNMGGPVEKGEEDLVELSVFYKKQLEDLESKLDGLPLGRPHHGRVTSPYGYRRNPFTNRGREMHQGVDLKGRTGDPVKATAKGRVTFAGWQGAYGYVVMVKHNNGYETRYAHLTRTRVKKGQAVETGDIVGLLGSTGRSTGPHLHYEVLLNNRKLNPSKYFSL